jgi:hypothetical protein
LVFSTVAAAKSTGVSRGRRSLSPRPDQTYRPPALQQWAALRKFDLKKIMATVRADDPAVTVAD